MTKPELGTKRLCAYCGARFYDLHHSPITCPKCDRVFDPVQVISRWRAETARVPVRELESVAAETPEARFVSSEDAESKETLDDEAKAEDEVEPDDESLEDAAFIEEREQGATDVAEMIGDDIEIEKGN
jgi:uncharacterized protein (TIGR02300 family)